MKAFFGKIWAWVLANKVLAAIIAGGTAVVLAVAIAVPCGVSASKKRKAAQEETSIPGDNSGSQSGDQGGQQSGGGSQQGGEQGGGEQGGGSQAHTHNFVFDSFVWTTNPGNYTAKAKYVCAADSEFELHDAQMSKDNSEHVDPSCIAEGKDVWVATYEDHTDTKNEPLAAVGHTWGTTAQWEWSLDYSEVTATITCENCGMTHQEQPGVQEEITTTPTCESEGLATYSAAFDFEGHHYADSRENVALAALGHNTNAHQYCPTCLTYMSETIDLNTPIALDSCLEGGNAFFRFEWEDDEHYFIGLNGWEHDVLETKYYYINMQLEFVELTLPNLVYDNSDAWIPVTLDYYIDESLALDHYVYVEMELDNGLDTAPCLVEVQNAHTDPNAYGFCAAGDYLGENGVLGQAMNTGALAVGTKKFFKYSAYPEHTYQLNFTGWESSEIKVYRYDMMSDGYVEMNRYGGGKFDTPEFGEFDNEFYVVATSTGTAPSSSITISLVGHKNLDAYGICLDHPNVYCGVELTTDVIETGINIDAGDKAFYKFPYDAGHKYSFGDTSGEINYQWIKAYTFNNSTEQFEEILLSHVNPLNYTPFMEDANDDGFIYLIISPTGNVTNGQLDITTIHNYEHGLCTVCYDYLGDYLTLDVAADPISVNNGEHVYFCFDLADLPANKPVLEIRYTSSSDSSISIGYDIVSVWYLKDGEWVEIEDNDLYGNSNWDVGYFPTMGITTDDGNVYIDIHADKNYTNSPGFVVRAVED